MLRAVRNLVASIGFMLLAHTAHASQFELLSQAGDESDTGTGQGSLPVYARTPPVSADGRWIAFTSAAVNLAAGQRDRNDVQDVFLHDRQTGTTVLVSHAAGSPATAASGGRSEPSSISADGRWLVYESAADDLVPGQVPNSWPQVYLYDRDTGVNTLVSRSLSGPAVNSSNGGTYPRISGDGNWIAYDSSSTDLISGQSGSGGIFLYERATGQTILASRAAGTSTTVGNGSSIRPAISHDGRYVAFRSQATNLVPGYSRSNGSRGTDVFLFDRVTGATTLVSRTSTSPTTGAGGWYPEISPDGAAVVFPSDGTNLVPGQTDFAGTWDLFLFDRASGTNVLVSHTESSLTTSASAYEQPGEFQVAPGGDWVVFRGWDAQGTYQVRLFRRADSSVTLVSRSASSPAQGGNGDSLTPRLTPDGAFVVFYSAATDLVPGQSGPPTYNVYLFDRTAQTLTLASGAGGSGQVTGNSWSLTPEVSADGSVVAYYTYATDVVPGAVDRNGTLDVALYAPDTAATTLASVHAPGHASATPSAGSTLVSASADGRYAVFLSAGINVVPGQVDGNFADDVFLVDRVAGTTTLVSHAAGLPTTAGDGESLSAAISADGAFVVFTSRSTNHVPGQVDTNLDPWYTDDGPGFDVFLYNRATGATTLVSHAAGSSVTAGDLTCFHELSINADGRYVAFVCAASNLVPGQVDDPNFIHDVFLYDRVADTTMLVSRKSGTTTNAANSASIEPVISGDGRWVAFRSLATDLVAGSTDTNFRYDIFLFDRISGQTLLVSREAGTAATAADGESSAIALNPDGRYVVFSSLAFNLVPGQQTWQAWQNVFLFDRATGTVELISRSVNSATQTVEGATDGSVSDDGRYVVFRSTGSTLVPWQVPAEKLNIFIHDRVTRQTELISRSILAPTSDYPVKRPSNGHAGKPTLSPDGRYVAFFSQATDLASGTTGRDVYLADRQLKTLERVAEGTGEYFSTSPSTIPRLSADGGIVLFNSGGLDLVAGDFNGADDVYAWVRSAPGGGDFFTVAPCRLIDTRQAGQGPALTSDRPALVDVHGICGIPATARAVAINVTVLQAQGPGRLILHPGNLSTPGTSTINFTAGQTLANNAILALASNGEGTLGVTPVVIGGGTVHLLVDITGWFE